MTDTKVKVIYVKEMRNMINYLKRYGLNSNGIIFGGLVRDEIIGTYYRQKFIDNGMDFSKYWDYNYDFETNYRLILPSDMDIYFKNNKDSEEFIAKITGFFAIDFTISFDTAPLTDKPKNTSAPFIASAKVRALVLAA